MDLLRPLFEDAGIEYEVIKNTRAIQSLLAPRVEDMFAQRHLIFGDNPLMRWYTQNVAVKIRKDGNKEYEKRKSLSDVKLMVFKRLYMRYIEQMS